MANHGVVIIISAPSGAGKLTIFNKLLEKTHNLVKTVSATTRPPRPDEVDGCEYYFLSHEEFVDRRDAKEFIEWAHVHGNLYGTLRSELERCLATGCEVFIELDVQGMRSLRRSYNDAVSVFIMPPNIEELQRRLYGRNTDSEEAIAVRLENAREEIAAHKEYDHIIINDDLEKAVAEIETVLNNARKRRRI